MLEFEGRAGVGHEVGIGDGAQWMMKGLMMKGNLGNTR